MQNYTCKNKQWHVIMWFFFFLKHSYLQKQISSVMVGVTVNTEEAGLSDLERLNLTGLKY